MKSPDCRDQTELPEDDQNDSEGKEHGVTFSDVDS